MILGGLGVVQRCGANRVCGWWVDFIRAGLGSAFTQSNSSIIGAETIALARLMTALTFTSEKLVKNSIPGTSDDALSNWAERLGVTISPTSQPEDIRKACAAKYLMSNGPTHQNVIDTLTALLGLAPPDGSGSFVRLVEYDGSDPTLLADFPTGTYWTGVPEMLPPAGMEAEPAWGFPGYEFGDSPNGPWDHENVFISAASYILIEVKKPASMLESDFVSLLDVNMREQLDTLLPAYVTYDWAYYPVSSGFTLDQDRLGFTAITVDGYA